MKKLLAMLITITSLSSITPIVLANASAEMPENKIVNKEINSLQTNDLEKLNRNKRQNNNKGLNIDSSLNVSSDSKEYFKSLKNVFNDLLKNNVFYNISYTNTNTTNTHYYVINNNTYNYFFVSVNVENRENKINLIFRTSDLYIQGLTYNTTYYHFIDSTITTIPNQVSRNLCFGSNYNSLIGDSNPSLSWVGIEQAFNDLINYAENPDSQSTIAVIRGALARVVWATSESMRFNLVRRMLTNIDTTSYWISDLKKFVVGIWAATTDSAMEYYRIYGNLNGFANIQAQNPSRILIFTSAFLLVLKQCNNRNARSLNSDLMCYKNSSMIDISSLELEFDELDQYYGYHDLVEIKDVNDNYAVFVRTTNGDAYYLNGRDELWKYTVPFPVTSIYRFETNIYNRNVGDVYFGTTNGVYLAKMGSWRADTKINGINGVIAEIKDVNDNYAVFVRTTNGDAYYLNGRDELWKYTVPFPVTSIYRFETNIYNRNVGDVYFGTTNGVYLAKMGSWRADTKINGINGVIAEIKDVNDNYAVFVRTTNGDAYYLNGRDELWKYTVPFPVTSIYRFETNIYNRNVGDVYFGTTNGVYLAKMGSWRADTKINGINGVIAEIKDVNDNYAVFVRTTNGDAYYLNGRDELWKYTVPFPVTSIYRFETNIYNRNVGDVYFGTTNGVYLAKMGSWRADTKINGINDKNNHDEL